jgi:hypothetical protein
MVFVGLEKSTELTAHNKKIIWFKSTCSFPGKTGRKAGTRTEQSDLLTILRCNFCDWLLKKNILHGQPSLLPEDSPFIVETDRQVGSPSLLPEDSPFIVETDRQVGSPSLLPEDSPFIVEADRQVGSPLPCLMILPLL